MNKRSFLTIIVLSTIIFSIGFFIRMESANMSGLSIDEKDYYLDNEGNPYMHDMDGYYNYRLTKNYLNHGYIGDTIVDGIEWDSYSYYPPGVPMDYPPLIVYLATILFYISNIFMNVSLMTVSVWIPALISPLSGIVAYLFVRRYTNDFGGILAGILAVTSPFFFMRTVPGFFDTDMFTLLFPLLVVWLFMESVEARDTKKTIIFSLVSSIAMFLFSIAWNGWMYLFLIMVGFFSSLSIYLKINNANYKKILYPNLIFIFTTLFLIAFFSGVIAIHKLLMGPIELVNLFSSRIWYPWPDVYESVSELQLPNPNRFILGIGPLTLFFGVFGLIYILRILINPEIREKYLNNKYSIYFHLFMIIWVFSSFLATLKGSRFILLILPPLIIVSGLLIGILFEYLNNIKKRKFLIKTFKILTVTFLICTAFLNAYGFSSNLTPSINSEFWEAGQWIKTNTSNDTIVISEWSYGHFFTGIAERPVIMDGRLGYIETLPIRNFGDYYEHGTKSPTVARDYWINRAFVTDNESLSVGIFRMLTSTGDEAFLKLDNYTNNTKLTIKILNEILGLNKDDALYCLINNYSFREKDANIIVNLTHPSNQQPYVLFTSKNMINTGKWIMRYGFWNFDEDNPENITYLVGKMNIVNNTITSDINVFIDLDMNNTSWNDKEPYSVTHIEKDRIKKYYFNSDSDFNIIILSDEELILVIDKKLENSLFYKLIVEGQNSKSFKSIYNTNNIKIWELKQKK